MEGCLTDIGMIFYFEDDSLRNGCCRAIRIEDPNPNNSRPRFNPATLWETRLENGTDSVWFAAGGMVYFVPDPTGGDVDLETRFSGKFVDDNTIVGRFEWGRVFDNGRIRASCPATFRRRVE
ncbi:MAG: hypothetical protein ACJATN_000767 [Neolewinella sp.]|jgi:hypothetical protein